MRVTADDELYRVNTVWLGPKGLTFMWTARYLAYALFLTTFLLVLLIEALTPLHVGLPPVWEVTLSVLFTYTVMTFVDFERPIKGGYQTFKSELRAPRKSKRKRIAYRPRWRHVTRARMNGKLVRLHG